MKDWDDAVTHFQNQVPELGQALQELIEKEQKSNARFRAAFDDFYALCRQSINPNLSREAVEEMLIQHLLTERIFRTVFNNPDFTRRNVIAAEIEKVIDELTSQAFSREGFLKSLEHFYKAIDSAARTIEDFSQKQLFLNTIYEKFFQGFSVKVADTHGVVYTPQPIVNFMVRSVDEILRKEFEKSLGSPGVHILDPFVGTGNFVVHVMQEIKKTALPNKYHNELHCNEVMLLPYYIASMNIEHEYYDATKRYEHFEGICFVDTFDLEEGRDVTLSLFTAENTNRVERQKKSPITVIIGNPPYNAKQLNENDNNKNRKYKFVEKRVKDTYAKDSRATNKNTLRDPYVKALRWASDRIGNEGIVALVTNNKFIYGEATDGMRKHLSEDFDEIYLLDLGGDVVMNPKLSGTTHNVFGIKIGVSINIFVRRKVRQGLPKIFYSRVGEFWRKEEKYAYLDKHKHSGSVTWQELEPDARHNWLTEGMHDEFASFIRTGSKKAKASTTATAETIFKTFSNGVKTHRDTWAYNFSTNALADNINPTIDVYNEHVARWKNLSDKSAGLDNFVDYDDSKIAWSRDLKLDLKRLRLAEFKEQKMRSALYRPFTRNNLFFDRVMNEEVYVFPSIFPVASTELENRVICALGVGAQQPFASLISKCITDLNFFGSGTVPQWFPFFVYNEDGTNRRENITDWALEQFRNNYADKSITKWDIFHYVYAVLHHPLYRERYAANLKRELPRIPFASDFRGFAEIGKRLAEIHVNYEQQPEYPLEKIESSGVALDWRVEKMKLSKDKRRLNYNDFLTLNGIPAEVFEYRLGNRSALDWIIDQYQVSTDKRSGITNDPNRADDPEYIVRLIGQVITVSLETVKLVNALATLPILADIDM